MDRNEITIGRCVIIRATRVNDGMHVYGRITSIEYPCVTVEDYDGQLHSVLSQRLVPSGTPLE